jgi:pyochelin synthetase
MTAGELLANLRKRGVELWADGDRLRYNAPKGVLTPFLRTDELLILRGAAEIY